MIKSNNIKENFIQKNTKQFNTNITSIKEEPDLEKDVISLKDSDLDSELLKQKKSREHYGIIVGVLTQIVWALISIQLKSYSKFFPLAYSRNSVVFWRSVPIAVLGYIIAVKKNQKIIKITEIQNKFWFYARELGNYFVLSLFIYLMTFFRVSTCQCIAGCHSVVVLFLSIIIINEPFYIRYLIGVILSFIGSSMIVLNERNPNEKKHSENKNIIFGCFIAIIYIFMLSCSKFAQKMMCKEKLTGEIQNMYLGILNSLPALLVAIYEKHLGFDLLYILYGMSNGVLFYIANYFTAVCFNNLPVATFMPITYFTQVFTFIFGWVFLGEKVYFTDIVGSLIICGFQVYNTWFPRKKI